MSNASRSILHFGIPRRLTSHPTAYATLSPPARLWPPYALLRHNTLISRQLVRREWHALQVGPTWSQPAIPALCLLPDRLIIGVGGKLLVHPLVDPPTYGREGSRGGRVAGRAREYPVAKRGSASDADIVGIVALSDGSFGVAQYDGTLQRIVLPSGSGSDGIRSMRSTAHYPHPQGSNIHQLASSLDLMMTTTSSGLVSLWKSRSPWVPPRTIQLPQGQRAWSSLLIADHPTLPPLAMLGLSGGVDIHHLDPSGTLTPTPDRQLVGPDSPANSSPYDLTFPPDPSGHHPSTLLSAWYDSHLRLHDLRVPSSSPVASFFDPYTWADGSAMYSCTFLSERHIAGGGARHGVVALWDIRYAKRGDGGRLWGVTERRAFVCAFDGSGSTPEGLVLNEARATRGKVSDRVTGWKGRGGKWGWSVRYNNGDDERANEGGAVGYEHSDRTVKLIESLRAV
ncbi:hypothetical protein EHS25_000659 [Saitozyma podzolica]|uniref:Uncharacterized protein n=1 Tax=Saitozyma podzolica TaxID=1890683 RepID=A0A427YWT9_9TREE|nr:hypothetical protein EHS25_000659 [Saitozyma podzolica]